MEYTFSRVVPNRRQTFAVVVVDVILCGVLTIGHHHDDLQRFGVLIGYRDWRSGLQSTGSGWRLQAAIIGCTRSSRAVPISCPDRWMCSRNPRKRRYGCNCATFPHQQRRALWIIRVRGTDRLAHMLVVVAVSNLTLKCTCVHSRDRLSVVLKSEPSKLMQSNSCAHADAHLIGKAAGIDTWVE